MSPPPPIVAPEQGWRICIKEALTKGREDLLIMPEWVANAIEQWLDATTGQPVCLNDFVLYVGAVVGRPVQTCCTEETVTHREILSWMPSSVSDAMADLMADLRARKRE